MPDELSELRRRLELAPDDLVTALRLAQALARRGEIEAAARDYMRLHDRAPETAIAALAPLLADRALKAVDAAWLFTLFAGSRLEILERAIDLARAFAAVAPPERAQDVALALATFPDYAFVSVILAFGRVEPLRAVAVAAARASIARVRDHTRFSRELEALKAHRP